MNFEFPTDLSAILKPPDLKKYFWKVTIGLGLNALVVLALVLKYGSMVAAKCLFIEIAVLTGLVCVAIFFFHIDFANLLRVLEMLAEDGRDETMVQMRYGRAQLREISAKLEHTIHPPEHETAMHDLVQHAMPLVQILISKEKNWMQLGLFGWRLAQDAMRVMKQTRNI